MKFYAFLAIFFFVSALARADDDAIDNPDLDDVPTDAIDKPTVDDVPTDATEKPNVDDIPIDATEKPNVDDIPIDATEKPNIDDVPTDATEKPNVDDIPIDATEKPNVDDIPIDATEKPNIDDVPTDATEKPNFDDIPIEDPVAADDQDNAKGFDKKLDEILAATIQKHKDQITPYKLEDRKITFHKKIAFVNVTGAIGFENITVHGLENIKREGNSYLAKTRYGNTEMRVKLAVGPLSVKADGMVSFLGMRSSSSYELSLKNVIGSAVLHFYPKTEEIYVKSFNMGKLNGLKFRITKSPLILTPFVMNQVSRATLAIYSPLINAAVAQTAPHILKSAVKDSAFLKDIMTKYADN